jgi:hypothetical protein
MKKNGFVFLLTIAVLLPTLPAVSGAAATVTIDVMTVLASNESDHIDPALAELAKGIDSRYSGTPPMNSSGAMPCGSPWAKARVLPCPAAGELTINPTRIRGNHLEMKLSIFKGKKSVFQTVIELRNNSSLTVGGPRYKKGYLLFNLSASF